MEGRGAARAEVAEGNEGPSGKDRACTLLPPTQGLMTLSSSSRDSALPGLLSHLPSMCPSTLSNQDNRTQALRVFQRSLSMLLILPVWQGMEAMSSR